MNKKLFLVFALLVNTSIYADVNISVCGLKEPNQVEMIECSAERYDYYDRELNTIYKSKIKQLNSRKANHLKTSQISWINQKEENCNNYSEEETGSNGPLESLECSTEMTKERIAFLKKYK